MWGCLLNSWGKHYNSIVFFSLSCSALISIYCCRCRCVSLSLPANFSPSLSLSFSIWQERFSFSVWPFVVFTPNIYHFSEALFSVKSVSRKLCTDLGLLRQHPAICYNNLFTPTILFLRFHVGIVGVQKDKNTWTVHAFPKKRICYRKRKEKWITNNGCVYNLFHSILQSPLSGLDRKM